MSQAHFQLAEEPPQAGYDSFASRGALGHQPVPLSLMQTQLGNSWDRLHPHLQMRFGKDYEAAESPTASGTLTIRRSKLGSMLLKLASPFGSFFPPFDAAAVPTRLKIFRTPGEDSLTWQQVVSPDTRNLQPISVELKRSESGELTASTARGLRLIHLGVILDAYVKNGALHLEGTRSFIQLLGHRFFFPSWLSSGQIHVLQETMGYGDFKWTMSLQHPKFGQLLLEEGLFKDSVL